MVTNKWHSTRIQRLVRRFRNSVIRVRNRLCLLSGTHSHALLLQAKVEMFVSMQQLLQQLGSQSLVDSAEKLVQLMLEHVGEYNTRHGCGQAHLGSCIVCRGDRSQQRSLNSTRMRARYRDIHCL